MATVSLSSSAGKWIMVSTILASAMAFIDGTALNVVLPALQKSLNATGSDLFWLLNAYLLMLASLILIGGAMANTFLAYKGKNIGSSKAEPDQTETLDALYAAAGKKVGPENVDAFIVLPTDVAVATEVTAVAKRVNRSVELIGQQDIALDIGDKSIDAFTAIVADARTVVWNGTLGYAELPEFAHGSARLALTLATHPDMTSVIGGGDTADFVLKWDGHDGASFTHVSTGGGASLDLMAGKKLPGVESLLDA